MSRLIVTLVTTAILMSVLHALRFYMQNVMNRLLFLLLLISLGNCLAQPIEARQVFKEYVYQKDCKIYAPDYFLKGKYFTYINNNIYSFTDHDWCAKLENIKELELPKISQLESGEFDFRIMNDSVALFVYKTAYNLIYTCNFRNGNILRVDTLAKNKTQEKTINEFTGGAFCGTRFYYLSGKSNKGRSFTFRVDLSSKVVDTVRANFVVESLIGTVKASDRHLTTQYGDIINVVNVNKNTARKISLPALSPRLSSTVIKINYRYSILAFVEPDIAILFNSNEPSKFALLNITNNKCELFELDKKIFNKANIRQEEIEEMPEDGPGDGLNRLDFRYFACNGGAKNEILLSFADKADNRVLYSIVFKDEFINRVR